MSLNRNQLLFIALLSLLAITYYSEEVIKIEKTQKKVQDKKLIKLNFSQLVSIEAPNFKIKYKGTKPYFLSSSEKVDEKVLQEFLDGLQKLFIYDKLEDIPSDYREWQSISFDTKNDKYTYYFSGPSPVNHYFQVVAENSSGLNAYVALNYEAVTFAHKQEQENFHRYEFFRKRLNLSYSELVSRFVFDDFRPGIFTFTYRLRRPIVINTVQQKTIPAPFHGIDYNQKTFDIFVSKMRGIKYLRQLSELKFENKKVLLEITSRELNLKLSSHPDGYLLKIKGHPLAYVLSKTEGKKLFFNAQDFWLKSIATHLSDLKTTEDIELFFSNEKIEVPMILNFEKNLTATVDRQKQQDDELIASLFPRIENFSILFKIIFSAGEYGEAIRVLDHYTIGSERTLKMKISNQVLIMGVEHGELIIHPEGSRLWYFYPVPADFQLRLGRFFSFKSSIK